MSKIKEVFRTAWLAALYSIRFSWRTDKVSVIGVAIVTILLAIFSYLRVKSTGLIISALQDEFVHGKSADSLFTSDVGRVIVFIAFIFFFGIVLGRGNWFFRNRLNRKLRFENTREINAHKASLDIARFKSKQMDDLNKQIEELPYGWMTRTSFFLAIVDFSSILITFIVFGSAIFWYSYWYGLIIFATALPMMFSEFNVIGKWWKLYKELVPHNKARSLLEKAYKGPLAFTQLLLFGQDPHLKKAIDENNSVVLERYDVIVKHSIKRESLVHPIAMFGLLAVIILAVANVRAHHGDLGQIAVLIASATAFQSSLEGLASALVDQWNTAKGVILIEEEYFGLKPMILTPNGISVLFDKPPLIRLEKVNFAYPETDVLVLKDITLTISPGMKLGVVGKSGSGKSSLQSLLLRHYDPTSGKITADGIDLRRIDPSDWINAVSSLTQEFSILERKIGAEIASSDLGREIDMEIVADAARFANFEEVVQNEQNGYETQIGQDFGGKEFSGGEKRRLALARVRYRNTPVLILDEPDSGLDPESAQKVMDNVFALKGVTVIVITHHVSRAERCDKIVMLSRGEIIEQGSHAELMAQRGAYASMFGKDKERLS